MARPKDDAAYGTPIRGREASSRPPTGRVCEAVGCETVLSTYNTSRVCWLHTPIVYKPARNPSSP